MSTACTTTTECTRRMRRRQAEGRSAHCGRLGRDLGMEWGIAGSPQLEALSWFRGWESGRSPSQLCDAGHDGGRRRRATLEMP